jgi:NAD(P)-dependent dehydrogenase (short-subunit alcohol dehydrogenase family)
VKVSGFLGYGHGEDGRRRIPHTGDGVIPMAWHLRDIPDLTDRVAVVTGAEGGPGAQTARALAGAGARVVLAGRDPGSLLDTAQKITHDHPGAALSIVPVDLVSLESVRTASHTLVAGHPRIDMLVNNAGMAAIPQQRNADRLGGKLGRNQLGHFALTAGLLPALLRATAARIISITGTAPAKLATYHFAVGLHRLFDAAGVSAASLLAARAGMTPAHAARPQLRAATDPSARSGAFYANRFIAAGAPVRFPMPRQVRSDRAICRLWEASEAATGVRLDLDTVRQATPA